MFGGFTLASFAPRKGKAAHCTPDDGYTKVATSTTLQGCFLECLDELRCENVFVDYTKVIYMEKPAPVRCTLLGAVKDPAASCSNQQQGGGRGTLVAKLVDGRPLR